MNPIAKATKILSTLEVQGEKKMEIPEMIQELLKVIIYLNQGYGKQDRLHARKTDEAIEIKTQELVQTFKSKKVMLITFGTMGLSLAGKLLIPGLSALADTSSIFSLLRNAGSAATFKIVGDAVSTVGEIAGQSTKVVEGSEQGNRVGLEHKVQILNKQSSRHDEDIRSGKEKVTRTLGALEQIQASANSAARAVLAAAA